MGRLYKPILSAQVDNLIPPETPKEYRAILPFLILKDLDKGLTWLEVSIKYNKTSSEIHRLVNRAYVALSFIPRKAGRRTLHRRKAKGFSLSPCSQAGCDSIVITTPDDNTKYCPRHKNIKSLIRKSCTNQWKMPDELERAILKEIIKISIPKKQRVVAAYFMDQITDAGALARKHNLSSEAEAMSVIIDAGVNLTQIINALKKYIDKAFDKPKNFWATQFRDVIIKTKDSDMSAQADKG